MENIILSLKWANDHGIWDMLMFLAIPLAGLLWYRSRKRLERFSVHISYKFGTGHSLYPNVIYFVVRNLNDSPVVIARSNFRFTTRLKASASAHGNLATGDYEIKYRAVSDTDEIVSGNSHTTIMLRHRESHMAYVPIDDSLTEAGLKTLQEKRLPLLPSRPLGHLTFDLVSIDDRKPRVISMRIPACNIVKEARSYTLGFDPSK
jgi:hypothetical protein